MNVDQVPDFYSLPIGICISISNNGSLKESKRDS